MDLLISLPSSRQNESKTALSSSLTTHATLMFFSSDDDTAKIMNKTEVHRKMEAICNLHDSHCKTNDCWA